MAFAFVAVTVAQGSNNFPASSNGTSARQNLQRFPEGFANFGLESAKNG